MPTCLAPHNIPSTFTQRALKWTVFLAATAIILYLCLLIVRPFLNVIAWSSVFVITCYPVHQRLVRKTGSVSLSAFVCSVMVVVAFVIPLLFLTAVAVDQFAALGASLQQMFTDQTGPMAWAPLRQANEWLSDRLGLDAAAIVAWVRQNAGELTRVAVGYTLAAAQTWPAPSCRSSSSFFAMFLLFRDGDRIVARIPDLLPFERARSEALLARCVTSSTAACMASSSSRSSRVRSAAGSSGCSAFHPPRCGEWSPW